MKKNNKKRLFLIITFLCAILIGKTYSVAASEYEYDDLNRIIRADNEDGSYVEYTYDQNGNIESVNVYYEEDEEDEKDEEDEEEDKDDDEEDEDDIISLINQITQKIIKGLKDLFERFKQLFARNINTEKLYALSEKQIYRILNIEQIEGVNINEEKTYAI